MECLEKRGFKKYTENELKELKIKAPDENIYKKALKAWDNVAKPIDGLGSFETLTARIGAIQGTEKIDISKKAVIIMCSDNGIVEEGVSQSGQEVTLAVVKNMAARKSSVGKMAKVIGADTFPIDIGINCDDKIASVIDRKIRRGTENFMKKPAMTREEALEAISTGIDAVSECKNRGYKILATGEMGIGNTTTSSAVTAALLGCGAEYVTGRGAGLNDEGLERKKRVIDAAIEKYDLKGADALSVLASVGGLDIAGLAGVCIGGALFNMPIVLDGMISLAAALTAQKLVPGTKAYLLPSHKGKEPAAEILMKELELTPVIDAGMALGEGTGAVMMLALLDIALSVYQDGATFEDINIEKYVRYE